MTPLSWRNGTERILTRYAYFSLAVYLIKCHQGASRIHPASHFHSLATFSQQKDAKTPGQGLRSVVGNPGQASVDAEKSLTGLLLLFSCQLISLAVKALYTNGDFTFNQMHHYRMAVTEREVINGCINVENVKDHVILYTRFSSKIVKNYILYKEFIVHRILKNINLQNLKRASAFIDIQDR